MSPEVVYIVGFIVILLLSLSWHEAAHAWVADRLGDDTARKLGRVTMNPLKHMDPFLSVILPVTLFLLKLPMFGGGKPVPINPQKFGNPRRDFMFVALAGPGSNILLALIAVGLWVGLVWVEVIKPDEVAGGYIPPTMLGMLDDIGSVLGGGRGIRVDLTAFFVGVAVMLNVLLALFNLLPVPPLDGSRVVGWLLPKPIARFWYSLDRFGIIILLAALFLFGGVQYIAPVLTKVITWVFAAIDTLTEAKRYG